MVRVVVVREGHQVGVWACFRWNRRAVSAARSSLHGTGRDYRAPKCGRGVWGGRGGGAYHRVAACVWSLGEEWGGRVG